MIENQKKIENMETKEIFTKTFIQEMV